MSETTIPVRMEARKPKPRWPLHLLHAFYYLLMIVLVIVFLMPFWTALTTSLKTTAEAGTSKALDLPTMLSFEGYAIAFNELGVPMLRSLFVTVFGAFGSLAMGSICAYALTKFKFKFSGIFYVLLVAATYLPYQAILIPLTRTMKDLNLYDNMLGLILCHTVFGTPMCTVMMRGYYSDVPDTLIKQAMIDGNGPWAIYAKIVVPNTKIANITVFVFQCTSIWNEYLFALIIGGENTQLATIALSGMKGGMAAQYNALMAGSLMLALPVLILYIFMGKFLIRGYMAGAVTAS